MVDLVYRGGPLMIPIFAASVVALAVFVGRLLVLRRSRVVPEGFSRRIGALIHEGEVDSALALCAEDGTSLARVVRVGIEHVGASRAELKERMEEVGKREHAELVRYLGVIAVVASIEPLLGLLGTVTGMIGVFQGVVSQGVGDPSALASGIWEALLTTAAGLATAIPAFIGWRYLAGKVDDLTLELEEQSVAVLDTLTRRPQGHDAIQS